MRAIPGAVVCVFLALPPGAGSQETRWVVDPRLSLAWWQVNPHLNHLWATTCPQEPSWRPGDDQLGGSAAPRQGYTMRLDTVVPLYPRKYALPLCAPAVRGEISTADSTTWSGTRGLIVVSAEALTTGQAVHNEYSRNAIYDATAFPDIRFEIDSLTDLKPGDTLRATVVGRFQFRGITQPMRAPARAWRERGALRVTARFDIDPDDLSDVYGISRLALGLGLGGGIWKIIHLGVDVVLKRTDGRIGG